MLLKVSKGKVAITLLLAFTVAVTFVALPVATAHDPAWTIPTFCYVAVTNPIIGVNQQVIIVFWLNAVPPTAVGGYGDKWTFTIEVTKPDNSKETLGPFASDPVGGAYAAYTPTQVGTYTIVAKFAEHTITGTPVPPGGYAWGGDAYIGDTYSASSSDPITLVVQEEAIQPWPESPLPTQFWTRPINQANRDWYVLAGNWLAAPFQKAGPTTRFGYGTGPESAHVMWSTSMWAGGLMDARFGDIGFATGHYEGTDFLPPIILDGKIYYNVVSLPIEGWNCLDLYTGEQLYFHNTTGQVIGVDAGSSGSIAGESLAFGQIYAYDSPNQHGGMPYLWSVPQLGWGGTPVPNSQENWMMFDAFTGNYMCSIKNVPAWATLSVGSMALWFGDAVGVYGKDGSILSYCVVDYGTPEEPNYYLQCWNTSLAIFWKPFWDSNQYWMWRPGLNETYDGNNGYSLNASIPDVTGATIRAIRENQYAIIGTSGKNNGTYIEQGWLAALNLKADSSGIITPSMLWNITYTPPQTSYTDVTSAGGLAGGGMTGPIVDPEDGVFLFQEGMSRRWWGYSLATGQKLWGPTASEPQMNFYELDYNIYDGKLLSAGVGGVLIAYDIKTGKQLWNYTAAQVGFESPYGNYPMGVTAIADGKIYLISGEHSVTQPMWRGFLRCVNASNGAELWKIMHFGADGGADLQGQYVVIADGYVVGLDQYDAKIYCYGKGPSATTVEAPMTAIKAGDSVVIRGTVTDQCAGAKKFVDQLGYANGIPAIADESMEAWMEYLYKQQAIPTNATGVDVSLDALDPNGNFVHLGTATSDMSSTFGYAWATPDVPGKYTIVATFAGSKSYYASYAETYAVVSEAPAATQPPQYPQPIDPTWTIVGVGIAMIIAIAIVGLLILRKR